MPNPVHAAAALENLTKKLVHLQMIAPDEVEAVEYLIDEALARHLEEERAKRLATFRRVK